MITHGLGADEAFDEAARSQGVQGPLEDLPFVKDGPFAVVGPLVAQGRLSWMQLEVVCLPDWVSVQWCASTSSGGLFLYFDRCSEDSSGSRVCFGNCVKSTTHRNWVCARGVLLVNSLHRLDFLGLARIWLISE